MAVQLTWDKNERKHWSENERMKRVWEREREKGRTREKREREVGLENRYKLLREQFSMIRIRREVFIRIHDGGRVIIEFFLCSIAVI